MVNTYLDILLKDDNGIKKIDSVFFCTNKGRREVSIRGALCSNVNKGKPQYIEFGFSNLCYNYPYRILISGEICPPSGEYEWYNGANFNLLYAYYRLTQMLGNSLPPKINYDPVLYASPVKKIKNVNGVEVLCIHKAALSVNPLYIESYTGTPDSLLLFPLLFKRSASDRTSTDMYYSYNPPVGLSDLVGTESGFTNSYYYPEGSEKRNVNEPIYVNGSSTASYPSIPVLTVNSGFQIWNIDLDKLNIGYNVARFNESY